MQRPRPEVIVMDPEGHIVGGPKKLRSVVADALCRWYREAEQEAMQGDVKAAALLGSMLIEGYGCEANPEKGKEWLEKARRRGYRMQGVYCEI
ncbi:hypothetical protein H632_c416p0 [Helicosporidium sp. ATCC 50920]|nr:hypothetical protein H632_c416p0 [Helicosporidium sp. ATCC 50920]|eukprot:KDD75963.1 hypothetical protein H632_c416p0 [Helicosporidium sp. ATCC 50920]